MRRLWTLMIFLVEWTAWGRGEDAALSAYEKACDAIGPYPFGLHLGSEEEEDEVSRTMRERRSPNVYLSHQQIHTEPYDSDVHLSHQQIHTEPYDPDVLYLSHQQIHTEPYNSDCDCGKGTIRCTKYRGRKHCICENAIFVIDQPCEECSCPHGECDGTSKCVRCLEGYSLTAESTCKACSCDDGMPCKFVDDMKLCMCYDRFISVNRGCSNCDCGPFELCFNRLEVKGCTCGVRFEGHYGCVDTDDEESKKYCDCRDPTEFCIYNVTTAKCKCMPNYTKLNGICTECKCDDENAVCDFYNGEKVCSCKNKFVQHNGTCVECFCGEGHSCELKNGSRACICQEGHVEQEGICKVCMCGEGEECELLDGQKLCVCKEKYTRVDGVCKECFCGEGHNCDYLAGVGKLCTCRKYFAESGGTCKECHCGGGHDCEFINGTKNCVCSPGFSEMNGTCIECFCGENSVCAFDGEVKICLCYNGSTFENGLCREICRNDTCDRGTCEIENDTFKCSCDIGFGGDRCDQKLALSKKADYVIYTLTVVPLFLIILVAVYFIRKRRNRDTSYYHKVSRSDNQDDGVFMSTVVSSSDR